MQKKCNEVFYHGETNKFSFEEEPKIYSNIVFAST